MEQSVRTQFVLHWKHLCPLTCLFNKQWKMKIISPCKEFVMANRYLKTTVDELKLRSPNNHVIPSKGRMTADAFTPAFTFSICVLFCTCLVPIIWRITRINTTIFICVKEKLISLNGDLTARAHLWSYQCELTRKLCFSQTHLPSLTIRLWARDFVILNKGTARVNYHA